MYSTRKTRVFFSQAVSCMQSQRCGGWTKHDNAGKGDNSPSLVHQLIHRTANGACLLASLARQPRLACCGRAGCRSNKGQRVACRQFQALELDARFSRDTGKQGSALQTTASGYAGGWRGASQIEWMRRVGELSGSGVGQWVRGKVGRGRI